jgi:proteasome accessory factor C
MHVASLLKAHPEGVHILDIAEALGVPPAEARQVVHELTLCGKPPFEPGDYLTIREEKKRVILEDDPGLGEPVPLSRQEAAALLIALRAAAVEGALAPAARAAQERLVNGITETAREAAAAREAQIAFHGEDHGIAERVAILERGVAEGRAVELEYYTASRDEMTSRRVKPYALLARSGAVYLVAWDPRRRKECLFKVERVAAATLTDERFQRPASFKLSRYQKADKLLRGRGHEEARVRFSGEAARIIREEWPPRLVEDGGDGTAIGTLHYVAPEGVASWVLAHGGAAQVLEPEELREAVVERARAVLALYGE